MVQALPSSHGDKVVAKARPLALLSMFLNVTWLYTFSLEYYWVALIIIWAYAFTLLAIVMTMKVTFLGRQPWKHKLTSFAFGVNAGSCTAPPQPMALRRPPRILSDNISTLAKHFYTHHRHSIGWVCVASCLQFCLNLMEEGWMVSKDFSIGVLFLVTCFACYNVFVR